MTPLLKFKFQDLKRGDRYSVLDDSVDKYSNLSHSLIAGPSLKDQDI